MAPVSSKTKLSLVPVILLGVLLTLGVALPFLIDLEKFKPQIQSAVGSTMNAEVDFKSIRLHAIPKLGITIKNLTLKNTDETFNGQTLLNAKEVFIATELWQLLRGKIVGELQITSPGIWFALKNQTNNLASLSRASKSTEEKSELNQTQPESAEPNPATADTLRERVLIKSIVVEEAAAQVTVDGKQLASISNLDLTIDNIGLDRDIKTRMMTKFAVSETGMNSGGVAKLDLTSRITSGDNTLFKELSLSGNLDFTEMTLNIKDLITKKAGHKLLLGFSGSATPQTLNLDRLDFQLLNISGVGKAAIANFSNLMTTANLAITSPDIASLSAMLPQHANLLQKASLDLQFELDGLLTDLAKTSARLDLKTDLTGSDIQTNVNMTSLYPAKGSIAVNSRKIDAGSLVKPILAAAPGQTSPDTRATGQNSENSSPETTPQQQPTTDLSLSKELQNTLKPHSLTLDIDLKSVTWDRLNATGIKIKSSFQNLILALSEFSLQTLGGTLNSSGKIDLAASPVAFTGTVDLKNVSASETIAVIAPTQRDTLTGNLSLGLTVTANGTTLETLNKTLNGQGNYTLSAFTLSGASTRGMVSEAFGGFVNSLATGKSADKAFASVDKFLKSPLGQKIPEDKKPKVADLKRNLENIKTVKIPDKYLGDKKSSASSGRLEINQGKIHIKSDTSSDLGQFKLNATTSLTGNISGTADLVISESEKSSLIKQSEYVTLLLDQNKSLNLPFKLGGTASNPKLTLVSHGLTERFERNASTKLEQEARKAAEDAGGKALKDALKKAGVSPEKEEAIKKGLESARKKLGPKAGEQLKNLFKKK